METQPSFASQWGFQCGKSRFTALLETTHNWFEKLENGNEVGAVFFDFWKAFHSVPHRGLLGNLENLQVNYLLVKWIHSYLSGRNAQCITCCTSSLWCPTRVGSRSTVIPDIYRLDYNC